jgi:GAF domain-containing protein
VEQVTNDLHSDNDVRSGEGTDHADDELVEMMTLLARSLRVQDARLGPTLNAIIGTARLLSAHEAGVILMDQGRLAPQATTGEAPHLLDIFQQEHGTGPCIEAAQTQQLVRMSDSRDEDRWDGFADRALGLDVLSMVCVPLWIDDHLLGTLSLYADRPNAFSSHDGRIATICATLAAVALADARRVENLHVALRSRDVIGQAKGILIERRRLTPDQAFAALSEASQRHNRKLIEVAQHLVETGELVGEPL